MARRNELDILEIADRILASIHVAPRKQRRLKSRTFWELFRFRRRTRERIELVRELFAERSIIISPPDIVFGEEDRDAWLILSIVEPESGHREQRGGPRARAAEPSLPGPCPSSLMNLAPLDLESEREVESNFVVPLLRALGYDDNDIGVGRPVTIHEGFQKRKGEADVVVYNGGSRGIDDTLIVVEAKALDKPITRDHVGQARSYAMWLRCPYYIVTNGRELNVWQFRGATRADVEKLRIDCARLDDTWNELFALLNRSEVVHYKQNMVNFDNQHV